MDLSREIPCYNNIEEARDKWIGQDISKYDFLECNIADTPTFLCCTNLVYEDEVWNKCEEMLENGSPYDIMPPLSLMYSCFDLGSTADAFRDFEGPRMSAETAERLWTELKEVFADYSSNPDKDRLVDAASAFRDIVVEAFEICSDHKLEYLLDSY